MRSADMDRNDPAPERRPVPAGRTSFQPTPAAAAWCQPTPAVAAQFQPPPAVAAQFQPPPAVAAQFQPPPAVAYRGNGRPRRRVALGFYMNPNTRRAESDPEPTRSTTQIYALCPAWAGSVAGHNIRLRRVYELCPDSGDGRWVPRRGARPGCAGRPDRLVGAANW
jgi:hypothetical protein